MTQRSIAYGADPRQIMEVEDGSHGAARPLIIIIHGGFWRPDIDRAHARPMAQALAAAGWTVALPEYARIPGRPEATLADVTQALAGAPGQIAVHNGRVVLIGHSAGGHLALWASAAGVCPARVGTLALAPVADLVLAGQLGLGNGAVARFLGGTAESRPDLDPCRMPGPVSATTLIHGIDDDTVPLSVGKSYAVAHPQAKLIAVPGCGHYEPIEPASAVWPAITAQLALWIDAR